jgi:acyl-coenzyme A thioesterase PaaI-like protein
MPATPDYTLLYAAATEDDRRLELRRLAASLRRLNASLVSTTAPPAAFAGLAETLDDRSRDLASYPQASNYTSTFATSLGDAAVGGDADVDVGGPLENSPILGRSNPLAPPLQLRVENDAVSGTVRFTKGYEGAPGCVHGGYVAAVFDETLGLAQALSGAIGMTARLTVNFRAPAPIEATLKVIAMLVLRDGRKITASAELRDGDVVLADAEALFVVLDPANIFRP